MPYKWVKILSLFIQFLLSQATWADVPLFKPENPCHRFFSYHSRAFPVDSSRKLDGEGLRFVFKKNPTSEALLNDYQKNLQPPSWPAYLGFLGLAAIIVGPVYSTTINDNHQQQLVRSASLLGGAGLIVGSYFLGQILIKNNNGKMDDAVKTYNSSAPTSDQIKLGITPLPEGGGQVNTTVPF